MIIQADAKGLEINVAAYLSQDKVMMHEYVNEDIHENNRAYFNLAKRLIAKKFLFRLIYGGTAYAYTVDPDFMDVSSSTKFWQDIIDKTYDKYADFANWHNKIIAEAMEFGRLIMPTGRVYEYSPKPDYKGELKWPLTTIKNYPVQGTGADVMRIIRVAFAKKFHKENINGVLVSTVHDSIVCDVHEKEVDKVKEIFYNVFADMPKNFQKIFGVEYNLPLFCEVSVGPNFKDLVEIK